MRRLPTRAARGVAVIEKIDGVAATESPLLARFRAAGWAVDYRGLIDAQPHRAAGRRA